MKRFFLIPALLAAFVLIQQGSALAGGNAENGAGVFKKNCAACHSKDGSKSPMSKPIVGSSAEVIRNSIQGNATGLNNKYNLMVKTLSKKNLSDQDVEDIAAFLNQ